MSASMQTYSTAVVGGLLSSSCCMIQLVLNSFSVGCAGFSVLTPYRALFLGLTASSLGWSHLMHRNYRQSLTAVAIAVVLSGMPELVRLYNEDRLSSVRWLQRQDKGGLHAEQSNALRSQVVLMHVEGLRCAACGSRLKSALMQLAGVRECEVEFESGRTRLSVVRDIFVEQSVRDLVKGMGYAVRQIAFEDEPPGGRASWSEL